MTDFFHEFQWQGRHMHALYFSVTDGQTYCPVCGETYTPKEKRKSLSNQQVTTTNKVTVAVEPKQETSRFAQWAFYLIFFALGSLIVALGLLVAGTAVGVVSSLALTGFALLTSVSLGILSLRENL